MVWVFYGIQLVVVVSFWFVSFSSWKSKLFLFSLISIFFSSLVWLCCLAWLWEKKVMFYCWLSLCSVCFQFACVLPFAGDFRSVFSCFFEFGALFFKFFVVHDCDFIVFLWLRSLFSSLVLLRCWAWLWEEKAMFMLFMSLLPFPPDFRTFFRCFLSFVFLFFIELRLFYSLPLVGCSFWVRGMKVILLYPCLGLGERSWALTWGWLFFVCFVSFRVNAFLYVCRLFC